MANNNDEKILLLKKQIEEKKIKIGKIQKFVPTTNCIFNLDGINYNLNVLNAREQIIPLLVKLNAYFKSAVDLELSEQYVISGYKVVDWISDLRQRLEYIGVKEEMLKLKTMEIKLDQLLSDDKKVELELNDIEGMLK
jgi:hypothetical protein